MNASLRSKGAMMGMCLVLLAATGLFAQVRREIRIPDIPGYRTLKCDLHTHTVFSDGLVWPTVRVDEAWREGLDALSITDHIEYQPHKDDVPTNFERPYEIALPRAKERDILLIRGAEITRETPPGHFNAIFLDEIKPLDTEDLLDCMDAADKQGAFIFWNHPGWIPEKKGWFDIHTTLYQNKYLRGIEVVNGSGYDAQAHAWALEKRLTFLGNSDIHAPSMLAESLPESHRSMTLVFAQARSVPALKEALIEGRTAIWCQDRLIGRPEYLEAIFDASVTLTDIQYDADANQVSFRLKNDSDIGITMTRTGRAGPRSISLPPGTMVLVRTPVPDVATPLTLEYTVTNFLAAPDEGLPIRLTVPGQITIPIGPYKDE
ncbi:MAG: hypothetical protein JW993_19550 [Sedimentisphaerales bacterium]|nr:hypothetical protein [Sedimentisphaerales bacterium]